MRREHLSPGVAESPRPDGAYVWTIPKQKNTDEPHFVRIEHLDEHPPHCPACWLEEWLHVSGISSGLVFPATGSGRVLTGKAVSTTTTTAALRALAAHAGVDGNFSASSCRSGGSTSRAHGGEDVDQIAKVTGHRDFNILYRHYLRFDVLRRAIATRRSAVAHHQIGRWREEPGAPPRP